MKFIRKNALLMTIVAVFLVLLGTSLFMLRNKAYEKDAVSRQLEEKMTKKAELLGKKPSRTNENVDAMGRNIEQEKRLISQGLKALQHLELDVQPVEGQAFKQELLITVRKLRDDLRREKVKFQEKYQFGFETYETRAPADKYTPILKKQLIVIEELVQLCITNRFLELIALRRPEVEGVPPSTGHSPETERLISTGGRLEYVDVKDYLYTTMPFELRVVCDTESLRTFLNSLCQSKFVFIPRVVLVENEKPEALIGTFPKAPESVAGASRPPMPGDPGRTALPPKDNISGAGGDTNVVFQDPVSLPFVLGEERLKVGLLIDWLEFRPDKPVAVPKKKGAERPASGVGDAKKDGGGKRL